MLVVLPGTFIIILFCIYSLLCGPPGPELLVFHYLEINMLCLGGCSINPHPPELQFRMHYAISNFSLIQPPYFSTADAE